MSVNHIKTQIIQNIITQAKRQIYQQFATYRNQFNTITANITNSINNYQAFHRQQITSIYEKTIAKMQKQIADLKQNNSRLRQDQMHLLIENEELKKMNRQAEAERYFSSQRQSELVNQINQIRLIMKELESLKSKGQKIVDFDQFQEMSQEPNIHLPEGLQIIRQVSQHDLSMSMSFKSYHSESTDELRIKNSQEEIDSLHSMMLATVSAQNQVNKYQQDTSYRDALSFLKNYNKSSQQRMKPIYEQDPSVLKERNPNIKSIGPSETINKIKRLRKINDQEINSHASNKPIIVQMFQPAATVTNLKQGHQQSFVSPRNSVDSLKVNDQSMICLRREIKRLCEDLLKIGLMVRNAVKKTRINACYSMIQFENCEFHGQCRQDFVPNGYGKLIYKKQIVYQGQWKNSKFNGWGRLVLIPFLTNNQIQRQFIQIDGNFQDGNLSGSIISVLSNGDRLMGLIKDDQIEGEGTFISQSGIRTGCFRKSSLVCRE